MKPCHQLLAPNRSEDSSYSRHGRTDGYEDLHKGQTTGVGIIRKPRYWEAE
jgi:hypothetical protein